MTKKDFIYDIRTPAQTVRKVRLSILIFESLTLFNSGLRYAESGEKNEISIKYIKSCVCENKIIIRS